MTKRRIRARRDIEKIVVSFPPRTAVAIAFRRALNLPTYITVPKRERVDDDRSEFESLMYQTRGALDRTESGWL